MRPRPSDERRRAEVVPRAELVRRQAVERRPRVPQQLAPKGRAVKEQRRGGPLPEVLSQIG